MTATIDTGAIIDAGTAFTVKATALADALAVVIPFAGNDDMLPVLNSVLLQPHDGTVRVVATNRYVLGEYTFRADDVTDVTGPAFLVPAATAKEWLKRAKSYTRTYPGAMLSVSYADNTVTLTTPDGVMSARSDLDGASFPQHDRLFPANAGTGQLGQLGLSTNTLGVLVKALPKRTLRFAFAENGRGTGAVTVTTDAVPELRAIVMPCRLDS